MRAKELFELLVSAFTARMPVLITGAPGIGKSDIADQATKAVGADLILSHPAVGDPTDAKGMPWVLDGRADFLPFGDLERAIQAEKPTVWFLDDLGQASPAVQASYMQLLLARRVNGHRISDHVTFIAATNRRTDRAGVSGILEPVKSRFGTIVELTPHIDDWCEWAMDHGVDPEDMAFLRFKPDLLCAFQASADLTNSPTPRTWANAAKILQLGLPLAIEAQALAGAVGEGAATERLAFRRMVAQLPNIDSIILDPSKAPIPDNPAVLYALAGALANKATVKNFDAIAVYIDRLVQSGRAEFGVLTCRDAIRRTLDKSGKSPLRHTQGFAKLVTSEIGQLMSGK